VHYLSYFELAELYLKDGIPEIFANGKGRKESDKDELIEELYKQIGKLQVELDWIKKSTDYFG
jgi:hypothetical protein